MATKLSKEDTQALLSTMYSRPLSKEEIDSILDSTSSLQLAYRSTLGGLDLVDYHSPARTAKLLSFSGRGTVDTFSTGILREVMQQEANATILYSMFASGELTIEQGEIRTELYHSNLSKQRNAKLLKTQGTV